MKNPEEGLTSSQILITKLLQRVAGEYGIIGTSLIPGPCRWYLERSYRRGDPRAQEKVDLGDSLMSCLGRLSQIQKDPPPGDLHLHGPPPSPGARPWTRKKT